MKNLKRKRGRQKNWKPKPHEEICKRIGLPIVGKAYDTFKQKPHNITIEYLKELQNFVQKHGEITNTQFMYHIISRPKGNDLRKDLYYYSPKGKKAGLPNLRVNRLNKIKELTVIARMSGLIPMNAVIDDSMLLGQSQYTEPIEDFLINQAKDYRSNWWKGQDEYVEVWLEKKALSNLLYQVTVPYGVSIRVASGNVILGELNKAKKRLGYQLRLNDVDKFTILFVGDLDSSGKHAIEYARHTFTKFGITPIIDIIPIAVTIPQVSQYNLPTMPLNTNDKKIKWFRKEYGINYGVEVDAFAPDVLKQIVEDAILEHVDVDIVEECRERDEATIKNITETLSSL